MKKLVLLFVCALVFTSCDPDDGPNIQYDLAKVTNADLPEFFEEGETYEINVTYILPSACHKAAGLQLQRGSETGDQRRDIYIAGVASVDAGLSNCTEEDNDLERENSFEIDIDENEPYTFYLWQGVDDNGENQYDTFEVPVGAPDDNGDEEN